MATSLNIRLGEPDVICLQEIENMHSMRLYHERSLRRIRKEFSHKMLIESNDRRRFDVAMLSRCKIENARTHQEIKREINYPTGKGLEKVFRRDYL